MTRNTRNALATVIYIVFLLVVWWLDAVVAIEALILSGYLALMLWQVHRWYAEGKTFQRDGIALAGSMFVLLLLGHFLYFIIGAYTCLFISGYTSSQVHKKLYHIVSTLHDYNDKHGRLPPIANLSPSNNPLLSWRVHLLPMLGESSLYEQFHLDESWDSDHNRRLLPLMPACYHLPRYCRPAPVGYTYIQFFVGPEVFFEIGKQRSFGQLAVADGKENTLIGGIARNPVPWTSPIDINVGKDQEPLVAKPMSTMPMAIYGLYFHWKNPEPGEANRYYYVFADGHVMGGYQPYVIERLWPFLTWKGGEKHDKQYLEYGIRRE